ncbi:MAG: sensor histidine kinase, partial [Deltaproteobacteria bacterium]
LVTEYLRESPEISFEVSRVERLSEAIKMITEKKFDAALLDLDLPDSKGLSIIDKLCSHDPGMAILVLTGIDDEKLGIDAVKMGAQDYLIKSEMYGGLLYRSIRYAMERKRVEDIIQRDKETLDKLVKEKTEELLATRIELEKTKRLSDIGTLAAIVAHELRNPLAAISMAVHNIKRKAQNPDLDKHLVNIDKKVTESDQIINNLLFYSRLKPPRYENINISDILEECADLLEKQGRKDVKIIKNINPIKDLLIEADPIQIKEVFINILNNAQDAVPSVKGQIKIIAKNKDEFIEVTIEDNGAGIDKDILDKVFDPFFTTKAKGTGLGLSVCRQIVNMHEGEIGIKSEAGQGASITVRLPKKEGLSGR